MIAFNYYHEKVTIMDEGPAIVLSSSPCNVEDPPCPASGSAFVDF